MSFPTGDIRNETGLLSGNKSLYIDLAERSSIESREVSEGIVLDYDANGNLVGINIDNASKKLELKTLVLNKMPVDVYSLSA